MERENNAIKFRFHSGSLEESMATCVEVMTYQELFDLINDSWDSYLDRIVGLEMDYYTYDDRIGWETYIVIAVTYNGIKIPIGFANGKLHS